MTDQGTKTWSLEPSNPITIEMEETQEAERLFQFLLSGKLEKATNLVVGTTTRDGLLRGRLIGKHNATWEQVEARRLCETNPMHANLLGQVRNNQLFPSLIAKPLGRQRTNDRSATTIEFLRHGMLEFLRDHYRESVPLFRSEKYKQNLPHTNKNPFVSKNVVLACHGIKAEDSLMSATPRLILDIPFQRQLYKEIIDAVHYEGKNSNYQKAGRRATKAIIDPIHDRLKAERIEAEAKVAAVSAAEFRTNDKATATIGSPDVDWGKEFVVEDGAFVRLLQQKIEKPGQFLFGNVDVSTLEPDEPKHPSIEFFFSNSKNCAEKKGQKGSPTRRSKRVKSATAPAEADTDFTETDEKGNPIPPTFHYIVTNPGTKAQYAEFLDKMNAVPMIDNSRKKEHCYVFGCADDKKLKGGKHDFFIGNDTKYECARTSDSEFGILCMYIGQKISELVHECASEVFASKHPDISRKLRNECYATSFYAVLAGLGQATQSWHCDGCPMTVRQDDDTSPIEVAENVYLPSRESMFVNSLVFSRDPEGCSTVLEHNVNHTNTKAIELKNKTREGNVGTTTPAGDYFLIHGQCFNSQVKGRLHQSRASEYYKGDSKISAQIPRGVCTYRCCINPQWNGLEFYQARQERYRSLTYVPYTNGVTGVWTKLSHLREGHIQSASNPSGTSPAEQPKAAHRKTTARRSKKERSAKAKTYLSSKLLIDDQLDDLFKSLHKDDYDNRGEYFPGYVASVKAGNLLTFLQSVKVFPQLMEQKLLLEYEVKHPQQENKIERRSHLFTRDNNSELASAPALPGATYARPQLEQFFGMGSNHRFNPFMNASSRAARACSISLGQDYFQPAFIQTRFYKSLFTAIMQYCLTDFRCFTAAWVTTAIIAWTISGGNEDRAGVNAPNPKTAHKSDPTILVAGGQSHNSEQVAKLNELGATGRMFPVFVDLRDYFEGIPDNQKEDVDKIVNKYLAENKESCLYLGMFCFRSAGWKEEMEKVLFEKLIAIAGKSNHKKMEWAETNHFWCEARPAVTQEQWHELEENGSTFKRLLIKLDQVNDKVQVVLDLGEKELSQTELIERWFSSGMFKPYLDNADRLDAADASDEAPIDGSNKQALQTRCSWCELDITCAANSVANAYRFLCKTLTGPPGNKDTRAQPIDDRRMPTKLRTNPSPNSTHSLDARIAFLRNAFCERFPDTVIPWEERLPLPEEGNNEQFSMFRDFFFMAIVLRFTGRMGFFRLWRHFCEKSCDIPTPDEVEHFITFMQDCAAGAVEGELNFGYKYLISKQHDQSVPETMRQLGGIAHFLRTLRDELTQSAVENILFENSWANCHIRLRNLLSMCLGSDSTGNLHFCTWKVLADVSEIYHAPFGTPTGTDAQPGIGAIGGIKIFKNGKSKNIQKMKDSEIIDMLVAHMHNTTKANEELGEIVSDALLIPRGMWRKEGKVVHCNNGRPYDAVCAEQDFCKLLVEAQKCWPSYALTQRPKSHAVHLYPLKLSVGPPLVNLDVWDEHFSGIIQGFTLMLDELRESKTECPDFLLMNQEPPPEGWYVKPDATAKEKTCTHVSAAARESSRAEVAKSRKRRRTGTSDQAGDMDMEPENN